jgi:predicted Zn-dependent protease
LIRRSEATRFNLGVAEAWESMGSFTSIQSAGKLVNSTIAENLEIVDQVAAPKEKGGLPGAEIEKAFVQPTGYESYAPSSGPKFRIRPTYSVKVIIRHDDNMKSGYRVVTSFPFNK